MGGIITIRLLVLDADRKVLLFQFVHNRGRLAGQKYWSTPGGAVETGETFEQAGIRELKEETGMQCTQLGPEAAQKEFVLQLADGEYVNADERYFVVRAYIHQISQAGWTDLEVEVLADHRWWSVEEIEETTEVIWPENLVDMLKNIGNIT